MNTSRHSPHDDLRDLVLVYEDLTERERAVADEHLATCSGCAALLAGLQRLERTAAAQGAIPALDELVLDRLSAEEREDAEASLRALEQRLGLERDAARTERARPRARASGLGSVRDWLFGPAGTRWALATASIAAVVVVASVLLRPRPAGPPAGVALGDVRLVPESGMRGATPEGWRTGQAFVLEFTLASAAHPIVFHVDPAGQVALLYPERAESPAPLEPAGRVRLPHEGSGIVWRFEGEPGPETFLVTASAGGAVPLPALAEEAARTGAGDRASAVATLRALLERRVGPVQVIDVAHQP